MAEIIKKGRVEILDPQSVLDFQLKKIEKVGRISYRSEKGAITKESAVKFIEARIKDGHFPLLEHGVMTVIFHDISIGMTRENNRHRVGAIVERSTRYVDESNLRVRFPKGIDENFRVTLSSGKEITIQEMIDGLEENYRALRRTGLRKEDARQVLPIGGESEEGVTTNFRQWRHIISTRTSKVAHWEIREVMLDLLPQVKKKVPVIFDDINVVGQDSRGLSYCEIKYRDED